jgi:hypothetical protein
MSSPTPTPVVFTPGYAAQSGRFFSIYFGNQLVGGIQRLSYSEDFGTHWVPEIGSDHKEPEFSMRQVSGTFERLTLNTHKIRDIMAGVADSSQSNVDLRNYQFTILNNYQEKYLRFSDDLAGTGAPGVGLSNANGIKELIYGVMFPTLSFSMNDATSLARETGTFIGKSVNMANDAAIA